MDRGLVDAAGQRRERVLLAQLRALHPQAVISPVGRAAYPWQRIRRSSGRHAAITPLPSGALGQTATRYSEVDPSWKPPGE
jgi:hypothetical protein